MYPVSDRWRAAVTRSHRVAARAELRTGDRVVVPSDQIKIISGSVKVDQTAATRRTCDLEVQVDEALVPTFRERTPLDPFGNELRLYRGIDYLLPGVQAELVPLGVFRVETTSISDGPAGASVVTLKGYDRADAISRSRWVRPYAIPAGTNLITAAAGIVADRSSLPTTPQMILAAVTETTPLHLLEEGADPWADGVAKLALAAGCEAYFDVSGTFVMRPEPQVVDPAVLELAEGLDCVITELEREYTPGPNGVIINGEGAQNAPVRAEAFDLNPLSPTYWYGPYGQRPKTETHPLAISYPVGLRIARTRLVQLAGAGEVVSLTIIPNPALAEGDVIRVRRARSGLNDLLMVESMTIPLTHANPQNVVCRARRVIDAA
ncbi:DUF5047 domain-containing protein [Frankia sp. AvcI1]|uniref:DUF5047 domain-containing protein n=1 Tax=Frankia sp. AvcI1 TaxID=573496 RepID=UPI0021185B3F|nr:DUF5047 domain-containing protein [Frankia sp. AvcI1]